MVHTYAADNMSHSEVEILASSDSHSLKMAENAYRKRNRIELAEKADEILQERVNSDIQAKRFRVDGCSTGITKQKKEDPDCDDEEQDEREESDDGSDSFDSLDCDSVGSSAGDSLTGDDKSDGALNSDDDTTLNTHVPIADGRGPPLALSAVLNHHQTFVPGVSDEQLRLILTEVLKRI